MENQDQVQGQGDLGRQETDDQIEGIPKLSQPVSHQVSKKENPKQKTHKELHVENRQFRREMDSQNANKAYYIPKGVPVDSLKEADGKMEGIISVVCAVISLFLFPFGIVGIMTGLKARKLGVKRLGTCGIVVSSVGIVVGFFLIFTILI